MSVISELSKIRNIGITAHIDAGKTTTTERILYYTGVSHRIGEVHDGNTTTDYMDQERERGITITSAAVTCEWKDHRINIIDTPGPYRLQHRGEPFAARARRRGVHHRGRGRRAAAVGDQLAPGRPLQRVPRIIFINKLDRTGADFYRAFDTLKEKLDIIALPLQLPIGIEENFVGVVDLVEMRAIVWEGGELGAKFNYQEIPADLKERADEARQLLLDTALAADNEAMEEYFEKGDVAVATLKRAIKKGAISGEFRPVLCGTAFKNKGVQPLLDAVLDYLPAPDEVEGIRVAAEEGHEDEDPTLRRLIKIDPQAPFAGLAFKIINDKYGTLTFVRVYSGTLKSGDMVMNTTKDHKERIGRMFQMHADKRAEIKEVTAGDIAAFVGLKDTGTGDTLAAADDQVILERMAFPVPVIDISVEPRTKDAVEKMTLALQKLAGEDPSLRLKTDQETGQTILSGMGELHLEIIIDRLRREYGVDANIGAPQVAYRETISKPHTETYTHKKQSGGSGQYAEVKIVFEPLERNAGIVFENKVVGGTVPKEYIPAVEKGIRMQSSTGVLAGFQTVDFKYTLTDGKYPRRRLVGAGVRDRRQGLLPRGHEEGFAGHSRADHGCRGDHAAGSCRRRGGRPQPSPWHDPEPGKLRLDGAGARPGAAEGDVRLHLPPAVDDQGPRLVHHAVPSLRSGAAQHRRRDHVEVGLIRSVLRTWKAGPLGGRLFSWLPLRPVHIRLFQNGG